MQNTWVLEPKEKAGQVTCIDCYDMTGDGVKDLIIGRDDGSIEVYTVSAHSEAKQIYSYVRIFLSLLQILKQPNSAFCFPDMQ